MLEHWRDQRFFFCQLEAAETLIWLVEAPAAERVGIEIGGDGGASVRQCCKMPTVSGKTVVMAMVIAWHVLNEETLFGWIVSDFVLNDAIESGLVKTPLVVVRDHAVPDARTDKSGLHHIYNEPEVKEGPNRRADLDEPPPDLVLNAYYPLGYDWREAWRK